MDALHAILSSYPPEANQIQAPAVALSEAVMCKHQKKIFAPVGAISAIVSLALLVTFGGCRTMPAGGNENGNVNSNANVGLTTTNDNSNRRAGNVGATIDTREPDKYTATLVLSVETSGGDKAMGIPPLSVQVGRNGDDRRVEFKLPDGTPLIYLDHDNHHYVIAPGRKQYAELTKEATGVQLQKLMTPGQIVASLKEKSGVEKVGEEQINGRAADKYRYAAATNTNTKAGQVTAEAFVYIDKDTGLPLRAVLNAESSGDVKGMNSARVVAEMRDIKTDVDTGLFQIPTGYEQVAPEKVRQQIDALTSTVAAILKAMMASAGGVSPTPPGSPQP